MDPIKVNIVLIKGFNDGEIEIEMSILTAVSFTVLTIYDMSKAIDREMIIERIYFQETSGENPDNLLTPLKNKYQIYKDIYFLTDQNRK